jgi:ubiquinone/menaquinone biosynthesis C-methylase UbiE
VKDDFARYGDSYTDEVERSIAFIGQGIDFFTEAKARHLVSLARRHLGETSELVVLDVGCGVGLTDRLIQPHFRRIHGADPSAELVQRAAAANPEVTYDVSDGQTLPYADATFDVAFAICVLHHVDVAQRAGFVAEMKRVTRRGGLVMIFEHNPLNPLTRLAVARCEFDDGVVLSSQKDVKQLYRLSGLNLVDGAYIIFLPAFIDLSQKVDRALRWLPLGAQHVTVATP